MNQQGFFKMAAIFVVFAATLLYFGIDVRGFVDSHIEVKNFFATLELFFTSLWQGYLSSVWGFLWDDVFVGMLWDNLIGVFEKKDS